MMRLALAVAVALACGTVAACHHDRQAAPAATQGPPKDAIVKTAETGPVKATVSVWPPKPKLGDSIYLRLEITAPAGIRVNAPFQEAGEQQLGRFRVVSFDQDSHRSADGGQVQEQTYTLEAQSSGHQRIPPLRLEMVDARANAPGAGSASTSASGAQEILTDEVALDIAPVDAAAVDAKLEPAAGLLPENVGGTSAVLILGVLSVLAVLASGSVLLYRAVRARRRIEAQRSAYDEAVAHLRGLADRGAPDADATDSWFVELSAIVRRYLEQRYDIRAPELTTDEFLQVASSGHELTDTHRQLLIQFLERCDRVKFAGYRPDADESLATLAAARGFVEDTRLRAELPQAKAA